MVMGPTHATQGLGTGILVMHTLPPLLGTPLSVPAQLVGAMLCAGAAVLPDLDHPEATAARSLGGITKAVAHGLAAISGWLYHATKTRYDQNRDGTHRGITHTQPGAWLFGGIMSASAALPGRYGVWAILFWLFFLSLLALRALPPRNRHLIDIVVAAVLAGGAWFLLPPGQAYGWLGLMATIGCYVHCAGDGLTYAGVAIMWPFVIKGQRWYPCGTPKWMRFEASGVGNTITMVVSTLATGALVWLFYVHGGASPVNSASPH
jgi:membrane-bound metal-dependent hydrolase YbcI (DUF457 family)